MRVLVALGLFSIVHASPVLAQSSAALDHRAALVPPRAGVTSPTDTTGERRFQIPAEPLDAALADFSRQAGVRVVADASALSRARSAGVTGTLTVTAALARVLEGTGFTGRFADARSVVVRPIGSEVTAAQDLRPVVVTERTSRRAGYATRRSSSSMKTDTPLRETPQTVSVVTSALIADQSMQSMADVVRYIPGVTMGLGEGHRDAPTIRGSATTADFFVDGVRDDAQYLRDLYNVERVEALKGSNAMAFGRGGGGGVINRVNKEAQWMPTRSLTMEGGSFDHRRASLDVGQGLGTALAARVNGVYERSGGFRDASSLRRIGINPTLAFMAGARTVVRLGYEYFDDDRTVDRGIPSFQGRPSNAPITTYFGNPDVSQAYAHVHSLGATIEHETRVGLTLRNRTRLADYDKFYQNTVPGAVDAAGSQVSLSAYNHAIGRRNLFNQTDATYRVGTGPVRHTLLAGAEFGRQHSDQVRRTGYFDGDVTTLSVPFGQPTVRAPLAFRQSATDADNDATAIISAAYVQDQVALSSRWKAVAGVRVERFALTYDNHRTGQQLRRDDDLISPRVGVVYEPFSPLSFYGSYSVSHLPSSGDQFTTLTVTTQMLEPERFTNREIGARWEIARDLSLSAAAYRLDRTNTSAPDPVDPTHVVQTGSQRTSGYELGVSGSPTRAWQIAGGWTSQRALVTSRTAAARSGATVPLVPSSTLSLWNRYQLASAWGVGLGVVHQADMYAAIDNSVTLGGFTRADGALYYTIAPWARAQLNVENLFDTRYYATSHGNNNIMPGASRTVRLSLVTALR